MTTDIRNDSVGLFLARELETILARAFEVCLLYTSPSPRD